MAFRREGWSSAPLPQCHGHISLRLNRPMSKHRCQMGWRLQTRDIFTESRQRSRCDACVSRRPIMGQNSPKLACDKDPLCSHLSSSCLLLSAVNCSRQS